MNGRLAKIGRVKHLNFHRDWENYRDLLIVLVEKELKVRYNNKALGYLWSIASPLTSALVYYVAFKVFMRVHIEDYPLVLVSGVFPWQWFTNCVGSAPNLFVGNSTIIKKVSFPRNLIPLCTCLNHMIHFLASVPVILLFIFMFNKTPTIAWLYGFPILLIAQLLTVYGLSLVLASINLFFRDLERLTNILTSLLFYFTPIIYPIELIPDFYRRFLWINPVAPLIVSWRELILEGRLEPTNLVISVVYGILFLAIGQYVYNKLSWKFAELI